MLTSTYSYLFLYGRLLLSRKMRRPTRQGLGEDTSKVLRQEDRGLLIYHVHDLELYLRNLNGLLLPHEPGV